MDSGSAMNKKAVLITMVMMVVNLVDAVSLLCFEISM